jgi:hypothetical protein
MYNTQQYKTDTTPPTPAIVRTFQNKQINTTPKENTDETLQLFDFRIYDNKQTLQKGKSHQQTLHTKRSTTLRLIANNQSHK